uniref:LytR/AlgR family response regulator transcription factor n=1 Tax=Flavobacterium sp. TaxID=239 RepID=UPI004049C4A4
MRSPHQCLIIDDEITAREILAAHLSKIGSLELVGSCKNALEAFSLINTQKIDLIFLDINMPEISGLSFAKSINRNSKIIFTTAYREYAVEGFNLQAVDYLLKPISFERFLQAVNKYLGENIQIEAPSFTVNTNEENDFIFVKSDRKMVKIDFDEILHIESLSDYIKIITTQKTIVTRETISNIESKLPKKKFMRIHRSFLIALAKIESFTNEYVTINQKSLPISRSYKKEVLEQLEGL